MSDDIVAVIKAQHRAIERLLDEALGPGAAARDVLQQVSYRLAPRQHIEGDEEHLLPVLTARASAAERAELGTRFIEVTDWTEDIDERVNGEESAPTRP